MKQAKAIIPGNDRLQQIEMQLLISGLAQVYGVDLAACCIEPLERGMRRWLYRSRYESFAHAIPDLLHQRDLAQALFSQVMVSVSEMFRDPRIFMQLRNRWLPELATRPSLNIWHAGCAAGEEVYSMAILLREAGLERRSRLYATDINDQVLQRAANGSYSMDSMLQAAANYQDSGGEGEFTDYYRVEHGRAYLDPSLRRNMVVAAHNLLYDADFASMDMIFCRNLLIYYQPLYRNQMLDLLDRSLKDDGLLVLGGSEALGDWPRAAQYHEIVSGSRIYRKGHAGVRPLQQQGSLNAVL